MELSNKEKKVQQVLSDISYDIDTDFLWKEVSNELDKKKKRKFLWFIPFGLVGIVGLIYLFSNYNLSQYNRISDDTISGIQTDITKTTLDKNDSTLALENNISISSINNIQNSSSSSKTTNLSTQEPSFNKNINTTKAAFNNYQPIIPSPSFQPARLNSNNSSISKSVALVENKIPTNTNSTENVLQPISLFKIGSVPFSMFQYERGTELIGHDKFESIEIKKENSNRFFITLGMGGIKNISTTNTITGELSSEYFDKEVELPGVSASLLLGIQTKNNWRFFGGFDYAQLITRYQNSDTELLIGSTPIENQQTISSSGSTGITEGDLSTTTQIDNDITWHNRHYQYNLQVGLSKNLLANSKFSIAPEFSVIQNIYTAHKGYYFTNNKPHFSTFTEREENPYRKNTGLNTQLGLNLAYQLGGLELSINTTWRNPLNTITSETNFYQTKNSQLSTQVRVNYLLNWENN